MREGGIDLVEVIQALVGNIGLGQQHIHVAWHAAGNRMDGKFHIHAACQQHGHQFLDLVLCLRDGHAIAGDDNHAFGEGHHDAGIDSIDGLHAALHTVRLRRAAGTE